mmetsp:Transcript_67540/g.101832  ORF Transcript_67540/g.101832 Transcript_67540/m.101832 type:complete len:201 (+) Transcript_67540:116-718(+)
MGCSHSPLYAGLGTMGAFHSPLKSGFLIWGGSHSPSSSSSQSSGFSASGSGMYSGWSQSSGLVADSSGISFSSTQSSGLDCAGSLISLGGRRSQSSYREPLSTFSPSIDTSYVLSFSSTNVYRCGRLSVSALIDFLFCLFSRSPLLSLPLYPRIACVLRVAVPQMSGPNITAYSESPLNFFWSTSGVSLMYAPPQSRFWS